MLEQKMRLVSIDINDKKNFDIFLQQIKKSFPASERTEIEEYVKFVAFGGQPYFILDDETTVGVCYVFERTNMAYVYYLAINEDLRNNGLGSKTIKTLKNYFSKKPLVLSIEDIESGNENALKRYKFYTKNGFAYQNLSYTWQGVRLMMLSDERVEIFEYQNTFGKLFNYFDYK